MLRSQIYDNCVMVSKRFTCLFLSSTICEMVIFFRPILSNQLMTVVCLAGCGWVVSQVGSQGLGTVQCATDQLHWSPTGHCDRDRGWSTLEHCHSKQTTTNHNILSNTTTNQWHFNSCWEANDTCQDTQDTVPNSIIIDTSLKQENSRHLLLFCYPISFW